MVDYVEYLKHAILHSYKEFQDNGFANPGFLENWMTMGVFYLYSHGLSYKFANEHTKFLEENCEKNKNTVIIDDLVEQLVDNSNKDIYVLPYSKAEYLKLQEDKNSPFDLYSSLNIMPNNDDTIEFLEIKAKECGYKH